MNTLQKVGYTAFGTLLSATQVLGASPITDTTKINVFNNDPSKTGEQQVVGLIQIFLGFVTLVAVVYVLWAGFKILTGGSDEKAIEQGKKTIINVVIGIVIMWLAYAIVTWVVGSLNSTGR